MYVGGDIYSGSHPGGYEIFGGDERHRVQQQRVKTDGKLNSIPAVI